MALYTNGTYHAGRIKMEITKVFQADRRQAVRLPKAFRFNGNKVAIKRFGRGVLLLPIDNPWDIMLEAINELEVGFQLEQADQGEQLPDYLISTTFLDKYRYTACRLMPNAFANATFDVYFPSSQACRKALA